jgi:hypothetical protein
MSSSGFAGRAEVNLDGLDSAAFRAEELRVANDLAAFELAFVEDERLVAFLEELPRLRR